MRRSKPPNPCALRTIIEPQAAPPIAQSDVGESDELHALEPACAIGVWLLFALFDPILPSALRPVRFGLEERDD
jgi:hypothetical protein